MRHVNYVRVKSFRVDHEEALNSQMHTYRHHQKNINKLKKKAQFEGSFTIYGVAAKYDVLNETHRGHICEAREVHEAHAKA